MRKVILRLQPSNTITLDQIEGNTTIFVGIGGKLKGVIRRDGDSETIGWHVTTGVGGYIKYGYKTREALVAVLLEQNYELTIED